MSSLAPPLLEHAEPAARRPRVGDAEDAFEREANELAERIAWRLSPTASPSSGDRLSPELREGVEAELPYDFSGVRLHTDARADRSARSVSAEAVTLGSDVAFARDALDLTTETGRHVLAHELVHTAQQGAAEPRAGAGARVGRSPAGVAQRHATPVEPDKAWNDLIAMVVFDPDTKDRRERGNEATRRFLLLPEAKRLLNSLWHLSRSGKRFDFRVVVSYVDALPPGAGKTAASGWTNPSNDWASRYDVYVKQVQPPPPGAITIPGGITASGIAYTHADPESDMGTTLQHELMHVEFIRGHLAGWDYTVNPPEPKTGHGPDPARETDPLFLERETATHKQMDELEKRIRAEAEERRRKQQDQQDAEQRRREEEEARKRPPVEPRSESRPSFVGGQALAEGGIVGLGGTRGTAILGADLVLGRLDAFHLGARGVYLSPGHLLAGGVAGVRFVNSESPIFFDIEAGIVAELRAPEGERLKHGFAVLAGGALGHEFGTSGPRMFVKVGGFVLVTDTTEAGGGASAGVGVRF